MRERSQEGTRLRLDDDLGIRRALVTELNTSYSFSEYRRVALTFGNILLRGKNTIPGAFNFDEGAYPAGTEVRSDPLYYTIMATYAQTVWEQSGLAAMEMLLGIEYTYLNFTIRGTEPSGTVEPQGEDFFVQELPLPFIGLAARYAPSNRWSFSASGRWTQVHNLNSLRREGGLVRLTQTHYDADLLMAYRPIPSLTAGVGYRLSSFVQEEESTEDGNRFHFRTHGPIVQVSYQF